MSNLFDKLEKLIDHTDFELFKQKSPEEKQKIIQTTIHAVQKVDEWAKDYPCIQVVKRRLTGTAFNFAIVNDLFNSFESFLLPLKLTMWMWAFDTFDNQDSEWKGDESELLSVIEEYRRILLGRKTQIHSKIDNNLGKALLNIFNDLKTFSLFPKIQSEWDFAVNRMFDAVITEIHWKNNFEKYKSWPPFEEYISIASLTSFWELVMWSIIVVINDPTALSFKKYFQDLGFQSNKGIRIANDLLTVKKDEQVSAANGILILSSNLQELGLRKDQAIEKAIDRMLEEKESILHHLKNIEFVTNSQKPEKVITQMTLFGIHIYSLINKDPILANFLD